MSKNAKPKATGGKTGKHLATFDQLPEKTKELMKLKEQDEKTAGPDNLAITCKIRDKAGNKQ